MNEILQLDNNSSIQIAGPTASGKSALAVKLAQLHDGEIINVDSMQIYDTLDVITARPSADELSSVPHHLYGHIQPGTEYSTGHWYDEVRKTISNITSRAKIPVFVGGTGLYFKALNGGLSKIPPIPDDIRSKWRQKLEQEGISVLYDELRKQDPELAQELKPNDKQRISRALEVFETTGQSIRKFQHQTGAPLIDTKHSKKIILMPERPILHDRIKTRFHKMMNEGAIDEVKNILAANINPNHTSIKAIGVREISRYLDGDISLDDAIELSVIATRQYAKRQSTWFRNQLGADWTIVSNL
jgi:tRNA dimethylallyltransferase